MALQIWLPLDGSLENKGCAGDKFIETVTLSYVDNGKIGKALSGGQIKMSPEMTASILNNQSFSFCCWVYVNAEEGDRTNRATFFGNEGMEAMNNRKFTIFQFPSCNDLHVSWMNDPTTGGIGPAWYGVFPSYQWTHVAVTYQNPTISIYINGQLIDTKSFVSNSSTFAYETWLFKNAPNSSKYLNDYRIYDTCLSQAEVREIAQGLTLHYKLDNDGFGYENLLPCGGTYLKNSPWTTTLDRADGYAWVTNSAFEGKPSTTYTISVECDGNLHSAHNTVGNDPTDKKWSFWLYIRNVDTEKAETTYDLAVNLNSNNNNYRKIGNAHVWTYTLSSTQKYISLRTNTYSDGETPLTVHWWNFKVEEGDTYTPWIPNKSSPLYHALGLDSLKVTDSSGYGRHGDITGNIKYVKDSPRYNYSYVMDGLTANRIHYDKGTFNYTDNFSYALWVKPNHTGDTSQYVFTSGRADAGAYGFGLHNNSDTSFAFRFGNKAYGMTITKNEWVHVAFTKSGTTLKLYKNGTLYSTQTFDGVLPTYTDGKGLGLGNFHYLSGDIYPAYGNISDFRIYCTVLSPEDIFDLYHTSAKIDKNGKFHTFEFVENDGRKITRQGITEWKDFLQYKRVIPITKDNLSYKPAAIHNSTHNSLYVDFADFVNYGSPLPINVQADLEWTDFSFQTDPPDTVRCFIQGDNRKIEGNTWVWEGNNPVTNSFYLTSILSASTSGTYHININNTVSSAWLATYNAARFGVRCDYSDGNGTISISNIKVTINGTSAKINNQYISANNFIER